MIVLFFYIFKYCGFVTRRMSDITRVCGEIPIVVVVNKSDVNGKTPIAMPWLPPHARAMGLYSVKTGNCDEVIVFFLFELFSLFVVSHRR